MQPGKFNVLLDSAYGCSDKSTVAEWLAEEYNVSDVSTCNGPNDPILPYAAKFGASVWIGPGSLVDEQELAKVVKKSAPIYVHEKALVKSMLFTNPGFYKHIGRDPGFSGLKFREKFIQSVTEGMVLHEETRGWGSSLYHGSNYESYFGRNCGVGSAVDTMSIPPCMVGSVYALVSPYCVRPVDSDRLRGSRWLDDQVELSWDEIERRSGIVGLSKKQEALAVPHKAATTSWELLLDCVRSNGVTDLILTYASLLGPVDSWLVKKFCQDLEDATDVPVSKVFP